MSTELLLLLMLNHLRRSSGGGGEVYHFAEGTCYEWSGVYTPHMSDNDWAKVLAYHGASPRLVTDRATQSVAYQAVASATRDGMVGLSIPASWIAAPETPGLSATWTITGVCG